MAAKYQLITELYRRTGIAVAKNPQAWQSFLAAACRNYKCRFDEQLLIYAQRPDAIAVAELDTWNKRFKRWVNKDSKGIAVFDPKGRRNTLKYYFDVSDTHDGYYGSRPVPIWQMNGRYEQAVIERLSDRFGNTDSTDLASALIETAKNAVEDNLQDYFSQLKDFTRDSFLEELDDFNVEVCYRRLVTNSVAFMLMSRCGLDTNEHFDREDFEDIINFNTPATINALGIATSDISESKNTMFRILGDRFCHLHEEFVNHGSYSFSLPSALQEQFIEYLSRVNEECCDEVDNRMQGIVRRMGLIAYRIMMVLTAVRHLENVYNVQADSNGIIQLVCQESDYFVAMNICDTLLYHAVFIYRNLSGNQSKQTSSALQELGVATRRNTLYNILPETFTKKDYDAAVLALGENGSTAAKWIEAFIRSGKLRRIEQGKYRKIF